MGNSKLIEKIYLFYNYDYCQLVCEERKRILGFIKCIIKYNCYSIKECFRVRTFDIFFYHTYRYC